MSDDKPIIPEWWPAAGSAEDDEWARQTLEVVRKVQRRAAAHLGYRYGSVERDDLESWLVAEALDFRAEFVPPEDQDLLDAWCRILYTCLLSRSFYHYANFCGSDRPSTMTYSSATAPESADRPLDRHGTDGGTTVGELGSHIFVAQKPVDPLQHVIELETMREVLRDKGHRALSPHLTYEQLLEALDEIAPDPGAGQCAVWGCIRPPLWGYSQAGGLCGKHTHERNVENAKPCSVDGCDRPIKNRKLCSSHYNLWRKENAPRCSEDDCTNPAKARGLCTRHYDLARANGTLERAYAPRGGDVEHGKLCTVEGCGRPRKAHALCSTHYTKERVENAGPCSVAGCDNPARNRGLCGTHYVKVLGMEKPPCSETDCDEPVVAKGLCKAHYQKARRSAVAEPCTVDDCNNKQFATGICQRHYREQREAAS